MQNIPETETEIINIENIIPGKGWIGSAKINGKIFTGEFGRNEDYHFDTPDGTETINISWAWFVEGIDQK